MRIEINTKWFSFILGNKNKPIKVKVWNDSGNPLPRYATDHSAGIDFMSSIRNDTIILKSGERALIPTDVYCEIPEGYELQIRPRSGLAIKFGVGMVNSIGTIDSDYRGNIGMIVINHGTKDFIARPGDRIAQGVLAKYEKIKWKEVVSKDDLSYTSRGDNGYGHSGI